jgi:hypothetical protein
VGPTTVSQLRQRMIEDMKARKLGFMVSRRWNAVTVMIANARQAPPSCSMR